MNRERLFSEGKEAIKVTGGQRERRHDQPGGGNCIPAGLLIGQELSYPKARFIPALLLPDPCPPKTGYWPLSLARRLALSKRSVTSSGVSERRIGGGGGAWTGFEEAGRLLPFPAGAGFPVCESARLNLPSKPA